MNTVAPELIASVLINEYRALTTKYKVDIDILSPLTINRAIRRVQDGTISRSNLKVVLEELIQKKINVAVSE